MRRSAELRFDHAVRKSLGRGVSKLHGAAHRAATLVRRSGRPLVSLILLLGLAGLLAPRPPQLSDEASGNRALEERVRDLVDAGEGRVGLAVARVTPSGVETAGIGRRGGSDPGSAGDAVDGGDHRGVTASTPFAIGSVTKGLTGMLLADLAADDVVSAEQTVASTLDVTFDPEAVGDATLAELASHRSGLPRLAVGPGMLAGVAAGTVFGTNAYAWNAEGGSELAAVAAATEAARPTGEFGYSNLGGALLGHALAEAASTSYPRLLDERILAPLGMDDTTLLAAGEPAPAAHATPHRPNGRRVEIWQNAAYAPAGVGVWSTAEDLGRLVQGLLDGTAPGASAVEPRFDLD